jgi:hypothetical protein
VFRWATAVVWRNSGPNGAWYAEHLEQMAGR